MSPISSRSRRHRAGQDSPDVFPASSVVVAVSKRRQFLLPREVLQTFKYA